MADWTAPFHAPSFSDDEFEKQRAAYVAKHGYTVTIPTLDDIIHLKPFKAMTEKEKELYSGTRLLTQQEKDEYWIKHPGKVTREPTAHDLWTGKERHVTPSKNPPERKLITAPSKKETGYTAAEWRKQQRALIPVGRLMDIKKEKQKKKDKYLAMLADPSPKIARNAAAILTTIDDLQDAVSTLACIGMVAAAIIGGPIAAAVLGPLGLIMGASTLLNMLNPMSHLRKLGASRATGRAAKIRLEKQTNHNPFSKEAKVKLDRKLKGAEFPPGWKPGDKPPKGVYIPKGTKFPAGWKPGDATPRGATILKKFRPTVGNAIEALQTTDQIFGVGISIGPIMGFVQGSISGLIRKHNGERVALAVGSPKPSKINAVAGKALRAVALMNGYQWHSDANDETMAIYAASLGMQVLYNTVQDYNPILEVEDIGSYLVECQQPGDVLTREILEEAGLDPDNACVWPQNGQRWISIQDLQEATADQATANLRHYGEKYNHTLEAYNALTAADDFAINFLCAVEGPENVRVDYLHTERIVISILDKGWIYPDDITPDQVEKFEEWCAVHEYMDTQPTGKDIWNYAERFCGFTWQTDPQQER